MKKKLFLYMLACANKYFQQESCQEYVINRKILFRTSTGRTEYAKSINFVLFILTKCKLMHRHIGNAYGMLTKKTLNTDKCSSRWNYCSSVIPLIILINPLNNDKLHLYLYNKHDVTPFYCRLQHDTS